MRAHSDVDIIADFPGEASISAASFAGAGCFGSGMVPDAQPALWRRFENGDEEAQRLAR